MQFTIFPKTCFFSGCFEPLKREQVSNFHENSLKKLEKWFWINNFSFIWWATLINNSSYEPHGTYVSGFTFVLHKKVPKTTINYFTFVMGSELTSWCLLRSWYMCHTLIYKLHQTTCLLILTYPGVSRGFPGVFPGFARGFPWVFPWFSRGFSGIFFISRKL